MNEATIRNQRKFGINAFALKIIAAAAMLIDHVAYVFLDGNFAMRSVGRLAFPIFAFFIAEGYIYTRDVKRYAIRLFAFSLVAQVPYYLAFGDKFYQPNVIFTLFLGLVAIYAYDKGKGALKLIVPLAAAVLAEVSGSDHGSFGVMMVFLFYTAGNMKRKLIFAGLLIVFVAAFAVIQLNELNKYALMYLFYLVPLVLLYFYNDTKGPGGKFSKWFFYVFYPLHLLLIWLINSY